jgi:pantoate--beta-alanine ligase
MIDFTAIPPLRAWIAGQRASGRRIGFVPTMGALHDGHLGLVDEAKRRADAVVMSIFVNPLQFGPADDLERYPRDLQRDRALAKDRGVNGLFVPQADVMYPKGSEVRVVPGATGDRWEGAARPGHFAGVLTVVAKLFHVIQPDVACFGRKDLQQLTLVRQMVRDLDWPIEIVPVATVREPDGLALSSRNAYLDSDERRSAVALSQALQTAHRAWQSGETRSEVLERRMRETLSRFPAVLVEYIAITEPQRLEPIASADQSTIIAIAARVGPTRLIDNIVLGEGILDAAVSHRGFADPMILRQGRGGS